MSQKVIKAADLFCGAGGTSTGLVEACDELGMRCELTAINHWDVAIATHTANHSTARHLCTNLDATNPRELYREGELDVLWASPECTHHSIARGGKPMNDQSRSTAWCVVRWAEALRPNIILVENVKEFVSWGAIGSNGRPLKNKKGEVFMSWVKCLEALGYRVDWRVLCAADYGDPTTRQRLFVYCVRGRRKIVWPEPSHIETPLPDMFTQRQRWLSARDSVIDWTIPGKSIFNRKKPLAENTLNRIREGLEENGDSTIVAMEHGGRSLSIERPLPTVTTAKGGAFGFAYILPPLCCGRLRPVTEPVPTVATSGAMSLIVEYYGNGKTHSVDKPLPTVTCKDRFALIQSQGGDVLFRMLKKHELSAAQGFPRDYKFTGNTTQVIKQIGNAVPKNLAKALVKAALTQKSS